MTVLRRQSSVPLRMNSCRHSPRLQQTAQSEQIWQLTIRAVLRPDLQLGELRVQTFSLRALRTEDLRMSAPPVLPATAKRFLQTMGPSECAHTTSGW